MKHIFKIIGVIVAVFILITLVARDQQSEENEPFKVAAVLPLTGPASFPGEETREGMMMALAEINKVNKKIELIVQDSKTKPSEGVAVVNQLELTEKPDLYVTGTSSVSMAVAPLAEQFDFPLIAVFTYAPEFTEQNNNSFRLWPRSGDEVSVVLNHLKEQETKKLGVLHLNDNFGNSIKDILYSEVIEHNIEMVSENFLAPDQDFKTQLLKLMDQGIDTLYMVGFDSHVLNGVRQSYELDFNGPVIGAVSYPQPFNLSELPTKASEGTLSIYPKISQEFTQQFYKIYGKKPGIYAATGYSLMKIIDDQINDETITNGEIVVPQGYSSVVGQLYQDGQEIPFELYPVEIQNSEVVYK